MSAVLQERRACAGIAHRAATYLSDPVSRRLAQRIGDEILKRGEPKETWPSLQDRRDDGDDEFNPNERHQELRLQELLRRFKMTVIREVEFAFARRPLRDLVKVLYRGKWIPAWAVIPVGNTMVVELEDGSFYHACHEEWALLF